MTAPTVAVCGTESGYQAHRYRHEVTCRACCAAHAADRRATRALRPADQDRPDHPIRYTAARAGREPAEALTTRDRWRLVAELHRAGLSDVEVAAHTRMSTHTAARIRGGMSLPARAGFVVAERRAA